MNHMPRPRFIIVMLLTTLLSLLSILPSAYGQGVPDQVNDPGPSAGGYCLSFYPQQSFTPTVGQLVAVDLRIDNTGLDILDATVRIISPEGFILGEASASVPPSPWPGELIQFDFDPPIDITPGDTYVIAATSSIPEAPLGWVGRDDNPYPGGMLVSWALRSFPNVDLNFITYGPETRPPIPEFEASIVIMVSVAVMSLLLFRRLPLLIRRP